LKTAKIWEKKTAKKKVNTGWRQISSLGKDLWGTGTLIGKGNGQSGGEQRNLGDKPSGGKWQDLVGAKRTRGEKRHNRQKTQKTQLGGKGPKSKINQVERVNPRETKWGERR